ncbi:glycoside hydrolase family 2 protein [Roseateles cellulosilyticus]|uniref:Beta galactosidase jelly roll domain-containing protein n=1 Tax=Pelomonas cellulosilytica TaxID=2906762 RepID=A0ABS8XQ15_9BURK|nr:glycoside hydrolase family 2 TIM barrel-domain containing protein [Pelomonas sp. P8]MCE4553913.1 beta galactosidase jelly roll domain-containing protein [Pelomonas sp. P8]
MRAFSFIAAVGLLLSLCSLPASAATRIDLNDGWQFRTDPADEGVAAGWPRSQPRDTRSVSVPHTWNVGADADFEGTGWYFRRLDLPASLGDDAHVELNFGAAFYRSRVWLNGVEIGQHEGGHTAHAFDISRQLRRNGPNLLAVAIDNRPSAHSIPGHAMRLAGSGSVWYDWWHYGGLVRDVWLSVGDGAVIRRQTLRATLTGPLAGRRVGIEPAQVSARVALENASTRSRRFKLVVTAYAPDGSPAASAHEALALPAQGKATAELRLALAEPRLWNIGDGQLYRVVSELQDGDGRVLDLRSDTLGLRRIELRDRKLWVNDSPVRLTGLTRHEDSPWEGLAETRGTVLHDWNDLRALHTTLTRPVHYPQHPAVLDYADRHGILLVPEIPMWQFSEAQMKDPRVLTLAQQMLAEMIASDGNHASIFAWSVCNESDARLPGGLAYVRRMKALVRELDPQRFFTFADSDVSIAPWPDSAALHEADFIMANAYFGSWSGGAEQVEPWLDFMQKTYPDKALVISEYGYVGPFAPDAAEADRQRIANLRQQLDAFARRDFVAGAIFWIYQDYKSHRNLAVGETAGHVDHGVVDENRQRKPSYMAYQQRNAPLGAQLAWTWAGDGLAGFEARLQANAPTQLPSYPLLGYRAEWRMLDRDGRLLGQGTQELPDLSSPFTLQGRWPVQKDLVAARLRLRVFAPDGAQALETQLDQAALRLGAAPYPADAPAQPPAASAPH